MIVWIYHNNNNIIILDDDVQAYYAFLIKSIVPSRVAKYRTKHVATITTPTVAAMVYNVFQVWCPVGVYPSSTELLLLS